MAQWFRLYEATLDDPKVQRLNDGLFKAWVNLLCLACRHDGWLPLKEDVAFSLRKSEREIERIVTDLDAAGLLDWDAERDRYRPHNWDKRQYKSDDSGAERVRRYREKRKQSGLPALSDYSRFRDGLIARDGCRCVYCGSLDNLVVDHMVPVTLGGTDDIDNLALACRACNSGKAGRTPEMAKMAVTVTTALSAMERYRGINERVTVTVTPSESETDTETESDKSSAPNGAGGGPPVDPVKIIFDEGIALLTGSGIPDRQARSLIGKWRSQATDTRVGELIREAREHNISHPVEWMAKAVGNGGQREDYNTRRIRLAREAIR